MSPIRNGKYTRQNDSKGVDTSVLIFVAALVALAFFQVSGSEGPTRQHTRTAIFTNFDHFVVLAIGHVGDIHSNKHATTTIWQKSV
ncbi:hypothetical protein DPMN_157293 [Dreissena polymorpha]|uniref:Uncharacterized protein n=1 Tax=Dreissena polymorpha TaxID=45954 RepID=A0A9D4EK25_DREPO|nr:hypothetical protein DPMN_157293 [Dreissena polymorpha]